MKKTYIFATGIIIVVAVAAFVFTYIQFSSQNIQPQLATPSIKKVDENPAKTAITSLPTIKPGVKLDELTNVSSGITLEIKEPKDNITVTTSSVVVKGKTSARADVFINDKELKADANGNFSTTVALDEGENIVTISVNDEAGNFADQEVNVNYEQK